MAKVVVKFGGTSLMSSNKIEQAVKKVINFKEKGYQVVVVVSAMGKTTDNYLNLAKSLTKNRIDKTLLDKLLNLGELQSVYLFCLSLISKGHKCVPLNGDEAGILTTGEHGNSFIKQIDISIINQYLDDDNIVVVAGFCGENEQHEISTLGRGGSDITAVALASVLHCACHIFTDVNNVYTLDPKIFKKAKKIKQISFDDMLELSAFGAKVLETRCVEIAKKYNTPIFLAGSNTDERGTELDNFESLQVCGVALINSCVLFKLFVHKDNLNEILAEFKNNKFKICTISSNKNIYEIMAHCKKENLQNINNLALKTTKKIEFCQNLNQISIIGAGFISHTADVYELLLDIKNMGIEVKFVNFSERVFNLWLNEDETQKVIEHISSKFNL